MIRYGLMFAALLFAAACASEPAPTLPPPAPTTSILSAAVPRTTGIAVTPEQLAKADPCGLANQDSLAKFGKVSLDIGIAFTECELTLVIGRHDVVTEQSTIFVAARRSPLPGPDLHDRHRRSESVLVTFTRANRPEADEQPDRKITIDGHEAVIDTWVGGGTGANRTLPSCAAKVLYRPLDRPMGIKQIEQLQVSVYREAPEDTSCQPAADPAAAALRKAGGYVAISLARRAKIPVTISSAGS